MQSEAALLLTARRAVESQKFDAVRAQKGVRREKSDRIPNPLVADRQV